MVDELIVAKQEGAQCLYLGKQVGDRDLVEGLFLIRKELGGIQAMFDGIGVAGNFLFPIRHRWIYPQSKHPGLFHCSAG